MGRTRRRLEAAGAPAAIDEKVLHRRDALDRGTVRRVIGDAAPLTHHLDAAEHREEFADGVQRMRDDLQTAGLGVGIVLVRTGADDELALVRLRDIGMHRVGHDHAGKDRFHRLGNERLKRNGMQRQLNVGHGKDDRVVAGGRHGDLFGADKALGGLDTRHRAIGTTADTLHFAVLDDVNATIRRCTGITPGDGIVTGRAAAALQGGTVDRVAGRGRNIENRHELLRLLRRQPFVVDAVEPVGMDVALEGLLVMHIVRQHHHAARRIHDVVVEILAQAFPELQGVLVDIHALVIEIVRADDGRVTAGIAAAEPALLDHGDIGDAMLFGEVVGRAKTMAAAADDDHVVFLARLGRGPLRLPSLVATHRLAGHGENRIFAHPVSSNARRPQPAVSCLDRKQILTPDAVSFATHSGAPCTTCDMAGVACLMFALKAPDISKENSTGRRALLKSRRLRSLLQSTLAPVMHRACGASAQISLTCGRFRLDFPAGFWYPTRQLPACGLCERNLFAWRPVLAGLTKPKERDSRAGTCPRQQR